MTETVRSAIAGAANRTRRPRDTRLDAELSGPAARLLSAADRLRRRLFDVGLRLHTLLEDLEHPEVTPDQTRATLTRLVDELDVLLRESGLVMLELTRDHDPAALCSEQSAHREPHESRIHHR